MGYQFDGWEGYSETSNALTITMNADKTITALFVKEDTDSVNEESFTTDIIIYPNPTDRFINVEENSLFKILEINVFDSSGEKVLTSSKNTIDVSNLASGVYFLRIEDKNNRITIKRFLKE